MTDAEILTRVCDLLGEGEHRLARGTFAKSAKGRTVSPLSEKAVCWCVWGAIEKVVGSGVDVSDLARWLFKSGMRDSIERWSDTAPYPEIIATLTRAAALAGGG